jgi:hypothetical protein
MSEWLPIESAPKDGREVDLWACSAADARKGHKRLCGYVWDTTYKCWRTKTDLHFINKPHESYRITHWVEATSPADVAPALRLNERYMRIVSRAVARGLHRQIMHRPMPAAKAPAP